MVEMMRMARILLVDDDPDNLQLLRALLAPEGHELVLVGDGSSAIRAIAQCPPDLVVVDLVMPDVDGFTVLAGLKVTPATRLIPTIVVSGLTERNERLRAIELGADEFLTKPVDRVELRARVRALLRLRQHINQLECAENVLVTMARAVEARDPNLGEHCERMTQRAEAVGRELGLGADDLRILGLGATLHDIGKIGIPDAILLKPGPLDAAERAALRTHPLIGESILQPLGSMAAVLPLIRHHHEHLDGSGYPDSLCGGEITLLVRILSVVDVFDALTTHRPYRAALSPAEAMRILAQEAAAGWWDVTVIDCLARRVVHVA